MEALCFVASPTPLFRTTTQHSAFPPIRTLTLNTPKKSNKNQPSIINATLTNPKEQIFHKPSRLDSLNTTPPELMKVSSASLVYESGFLGVVPEKKAAPAGKGGDGVHNATVATTYLTKILSSKVYDVAVETPLDYASKLSERLGVHFWLKREDLQPGVRKFFFFFFFSKCHESVSIVVLYFVYQNFEKKEEDYIQKMHFQIITPKLAL
jgi:threonine dehydratase